MWKCMFICVIFVTSSTIAKLSANRVFPCSSDRAGNLNNLNQNGTGCLDIDYVCDGIRHCPDSSDEVACPNPKKRSKRAGVCILPAYPKNGRYEVLNHQNARPGQSFNSARLTVSCRRGYGVVQADGSDRSNKMFCIDGVWEQNMPQCVRFCKLDPDPSVRYICHVPGVGLKVCDDYVAPGTLVSPACNTPVYYSTENFSNMKCRSGFWNYVAKCKVECGRVTPEAFQLITDGKEAKRGELPWHVGIYRKEKNNHFEQICGGSLVSNKVVVSAAHCFWSDFRKLLPAADYSVAIGKLYREWNSEEDVDAQKAEVQQIKIPGLFEGVAANFQEDIAVLILTTPFVYKTYIRPVCLNFNTNFERWQLAPEKSGKVAGWGLTSSNGVESPILKVVNMPFVTEVTCVNTLPLSFREYITGDKFCAGYTNGTALCKGDSGGGLAFPDQELGIDRFYLRGIVSASPRSDGKKCNNYAYTTFTKITKHQELINEALAESVDKVCPYYLFQCDNGTCLDQGADCNGKQDCADGSDESEELCGPAIENYNTSLTSTACVLPPYPNHGMYVVTNLTNAGPGLALDFFVLTVTCSEGYQLTDTDGEVKNRSKVFCNNGIWYQSIPKCVRPSYEWKSFKDKCISSPACFSGLQDTDRPKTPLCTSNDTSLIYCTDCELVNDKRLLLFDPVLGIMTKTGTNKAKDKCLDYINTLDYPCKKDGTVRDDNYQLDTTRNCIRKNNIKQSGKRNTLRRDALRGEFPFMALLASYDRFARQEIFKCTGTVISERYILTSTYCNNDPTRFAALGILKRSDPVDLWQRYDVEGGFNYNGIGLLRTKQEIKFSSTILPACLHADGEMDKEAYVTGWDVYSPYEDQADILHTTSVTGLTEEECEKLPPDTESVNNLNKNLSLKCYVQTNSTRSACQIGSGSPLLSQNHEQCVYTVVGVLSHVRSCGVRGEPGMYMRIKDYLPFIEEDIWGRKTEKLKSP